MKKIKARIERGQIILDFEGFSGNTCSQEEDVIRALYGKMGVKTNVEHSDNQRETETQATFVAQTGKIGN